MKTKLTGLADFRKSDIPENYKNAEAVIFTAYPFDQDWIGEKTPIDVQQIQSQLSDPFILRYAGDLDEEYLKVKV